MHNPQFSNKDTKINRFKISQTTIKSLSRSGRSWLTIHTHPSFKFILPFLLKGSVHRLVFSGAFA
jgi:hypothetical protein